MTKKLLIALFPIALLCSCKSTKKAAIDNTASTLLITDESFRKPITDKELYKSTTESVALDTVYISKDTLNIITKKINGCDGENFKLIWTGNFDKAVPPQTGVKLFQLGEGACKERHKFHLTYNMAPLKFKGDTATIKTTDIKVGGWGKMTHYIHN